VTARWISRWAFRLWLLCGVIEIAYFVLGPGEALPLPSGILFWAMFTEIFYDWIRSRSENEDRALFLTELADLIRLGIPVDQALNKIAELRGQRFGYRFAEFTKTIKEIAERVSQGEQLALTFRDVSGVPSLWATFLPFTEEPELFADRLEDFAQNERSRLNLPYLSLLRLQFMVPILVGIAAFVTTYIMPTFVELHEGLNIQLPLPTRIFLAVRVGLDSFGLIWLLSLFLLLVLLSIASPRIRLLFWKLTYYLPGFRTLVSLQSQSTVYQVLATGLRAGAPVSDCFREAALSASISKYRHHLMELSLSDEPSVSRGLGLAPELFGPTFRWLIEQGERLENLPDALQSAAEVAALESDQLSKRAVLKLDTLIIAIIGAMVGLVALGVMLPLYQVIGNIW
jgi:type II secretory pathway component PulF